MTIDELIQTLTHLRSEGYGSWEVRLMTNGLDPSESDIVGVTDTAEMSSYDQSCPQGGHGWRHSQTRPEQSDVFYLVEGKRLGPGNPDAWVVAE